MLVRSLIFFELQFDSLEDVCELTFTLTLTWQLVVCTCDWK